MKQINIPLDMDKEDSIEAERLFINAIERINQAKIKITSIHEDKLSFLARQYNDNVIDIKKLVSGLEFIIQESFSLSGKNIN